MNLSFLKPKQPDIAPLVNAIAAGRDDTLARFLPAERWPMLAQYLDFEEVQRGHVLMSQGALDRTLYFVESGSLRVHYGDKAGQIQVATLTRGSVVGEGAFFSHIERNATVQALEPTRIWGLTPARFDQLAKQDTATALALALALGAIVATRMLDISKRIAVT